MSAQNTIELLLTLKDLASAAVTGAFSRMSQANKAYSDTVQQFNGHVNASAQSLINMAAQVVSVAAVTRAFKAGLQVVDDYRLATIGIGATLTDMAAEGSGDLKKVYDTNLAYAQETYSKVELAAAKYFASGKEMIEGWKVLTQKGVVVSSDKDIDNLGLIVDKIKLATQGQSSGLQIAQELRSAMSGQVKASDQLAQILRAQIGPEWEDQLKKAREQGTVLEFIAAQFQGLKYASGDIGNTLESQKSTLGTILSQIGREGLAGAYDDIVGYLKEANEYLVAHKQELSAGIEAGWIRVKGVIDEVRSSIETISTLTRGISTLSTDHPVEFALAKDLLGLIVEIGIAITLLRKFGDLANWVEGIFSANWKFLKVLFGGILAPIAAVITAILGIEGAAATALAALVLIGVAVTAALSSDRFKDWISNWEIAGLKVSEYVELAKSYLSVLWEYMTSGFSLAIAAIAKEFPSLAEATKGVFDTIKEDAKGACEYLEKKFQGTIAWIKEQASSGFLGVMIKHVGRPEDYELTGAMLPGATKDSPEATEIKRARDEALQAERRLRDTLYFYQELRLQGAKPPLEKPKDWLKPPIEKPKDWLKDDSSSLEEEKPYTYKSIPYDPLSAPKSTEPNPIRTPKPDEDDEAAKKKKGAFNAARELARAEMDLEKAKTAHSLELIHQEETALEHKYATGQESAAQYYLELESLAKRKSDATVIGLENEKRTLQETLQMQLQAAKSPQQAGAIKLKFEAQIMGFDDKIQAEKEKLVKELDSLSERRKQSAREIVDTQARALDQILNMEGLSLEQRLALNARYLEMRTAQIHAESLEIAKKSGDSVLAKQWETAQIKALDKDLRAATLQQLRAMVSDEKTLLAEREKAWREIEEKMERGQIGMWDSFKLGIQKASSDFTNASQQMYKTGQDIWSGLKGGLSDFLSQAFQGKLKTAKDYWNAFCDAMYKSFSNVLTKMLDRWLESFLSGLFGDLFGNMFGGGGSDFKYNTKLDPPNLNEGFNSSSQVTESTAVSHFLASNLRMLQMAQAPAFIAPGSQFLAQQSAQSAPASNQVVINLHNQSGTAMQARQQGEPRMDGRRMVLDMVLYGAQNDDAFRESLARLLPVR